MPGDNQTGSRVDPLRAFNFKLEVQGVTEAHFMQCVGLGVDIESISYREAGNSQLVHRLPGRRTYPDVTLCWGLTASTGMWEWLLQIVDGDVQRKNVSVVVLDTDGTTEATRWDLENTWPCSWRGSPLDALCSECAIEKMTLCCEKLTRG